MAHAGYVWNSEVGNYSKPRDPQPVAPAALHAVGHTAPAAHGPVGHVPSGGEPHAALSRTSVERYLPLLQLLHENQSRLTAILEDERTRSEQQPPRYTVRGVKSPCSFYMVKCLNAMAKDFAEERNVKLTEVVEAALVEFMERHGYAEQLKCLLGS